MWFVDGLPWVTDVTAHDKVTGQDFFFHVRCTSFHIHSPHLTFFLGFIVLFQSWCCHGQVFGRTIVNEFHPFCIAGTCSLRSTTTVKTFWKWSAIKLNYKKNVNVNRKFCYWKCISVILTVDNAYVRWKILPSCFLSPWSTILHWI